MNEFLTRIAFSREFLMENLDVKILLHNSQPFINDVSFPLENVLTGVRALGY
jgi:hypothetical protein